MHAEKILKTHCYGYWAKLWCKVLVLLLFCVMVIYSSLLLMIFSDPESANVIVTAGHGGLKFWDLRYI